MTEKQKNATKLDARRRTDGWMDGWTRPTHDRTNEGGTDGRGDAGATSGPEGAAGGIEGERELLVGELGVEHERDEAEREHRRRRDEHEEVRCGARQATVTAALVVDEDVDGSS